VSRPRLPPWVRCAWLVIACVVLLGVPAIARAHESRVASLALVETEPGRFLIRWVAPATVAGGETWAPRPLFPRGCQERGTVLECGDVGLAGSIEFPALRAGATSVAVHVTWQGGHEQSYLLTPERPVLALNGVLPSPTGRLLVALQYTRLGIQHILTGFDHVLFVIGLMLLVRFGKQLLVTITAFTLAHSVTLVSAVLGLVTVPERPVEVVIALSLLLVAIECGRPGVPTLSRRYPWIVAFGFGLLHGFGFAGALSEIGLPQHQLALALGCFNLGVELGQLAIVLVAWLATRVIQKFFREDKREQLIRSERGFVYAMGSLSAYWVLDRLLRMFG
jgi:hydrogenase/urease accessory protein HupE